MNDFNDELSGIFDDLNPDDFIPFQGADAFQKFFMQAIDATRFAWLSAEGNINPVAILASPSERWFLPADDGETLGQYIERVRLNAQENDARWLFISRRTTVANWTVDDADQIPGDPTSPEAIAEGIRLGHAREGVFYYAEQYDPSERDIRYGVMLPEDDGHLSEPDEGNTTLQVVGLFANILG